MRCSLLRKWNVFPAWLDVESGGLSISWSRPYCDQNHTAGTKSLFQMQILRDYITFRQWFHSCLCHSAHHLTGSYPPTLSIYPLVFCASLQSGGIVGQGHWDNPLVLCRINDKALNYTQLVPMTIQPPPPPSLPLSLWQTDSGWTRSLAQGLTGFHFTVRFCLDLPGKEGEAAWKQKQKRKRKGNWKITEPDFVWKEKSRYERDLTTNKWFP